MPVEIDVLVAVHHPTRRRILDLLVVEGPAQVGTVARVLGVQVGSASHHLRMLQRAGVVAPAPELSTDGRTSWWRATGTSRSWSADDFADNAADRVRAEAAERLDAQRSMHKLAEWHRSKTSAPAAHRQAATSVDWSVRATPEQLRALGDVLQKTVAAWVAQVREDQPPADETIPAHGFVRIFPSAP